MAGRGTCRRRGALGRLGDEEGWSGQCLGGGGVAGDAPQRRHGVGGRAARSGAPAPPLLLLGVEVSEGEWGVVVWCKGEPGVELK